jgi:hypothetical protein
VPSRWLLRHRVKPSRSKYSYLPKFGIWCMVRPIPVHQEGRSYVVTICEPGCGGRGSAGHEKARTGRIALRESLPSCGRTALRVRLASILPAKSTRPSRHGRRTLRRIGRASRTAKPCGPGRRCYGQALRRRTPAQPGGTAPSIREVTETRGIRLRGERGISRQTTAQGRPGVRLHLWFSRCERLSTQSAQRAMGAGRHPVFPAPS